MEFCRNILLVTTLFAMTASAKGLYLESTIGVAHSDYIEQENPRRLRMAEDHVYECWERPDCVDSGPSGEYAPRDRMEYLGYGPVLDLKVGYGWEKLAIFGVIQGMYSEGLHEIDSYVVGESVDYETSADDADWYRHNHVQERIDYVRFSELHSNATRLFLGTGFTFFPFAKKGAELTGFHAGASIGLSIIETKIYECKNAINRRHGFTEIAVGGNSSITLDMGYTWSINKNWNMGAAFTAAFENPPESEKKYSMFNLHTLWAGLRFTRK